MPRLQTNQKQLKFLSKRLPPDLIEEVVDFASFLEKRHNISKSASSKSQLNKNRHLKGDWIGCLHDVGDQGLTGLDLQQESISIRTKNALD